MEYLFWSLKFRLIEFVSDFAFRISIFLLKSACRKHITLCQIITYEKQAPQFKQFGVPFGAISRVIRE